MIPRNSYYLLKYAFLCIQSIQSRTSEFFLLLEICYQVKIMEKLSLEEGLLSLYRQLFEVVLLFILFLTLVSCCVSLCCCYGQEPRQGSELRGWKGTKGSVGTADMFILSRLTQQA